MKIAIDIGHNCQHDTGARGIDKSEDNLVLELGVKLKKLLVKEGHHVIDVHPVNTGSLWGSLAQRVAKANSAKADLFVSLHFNALNGRAYGAEVFGISTPSQLVGRRVLNEICKLGFYDRGVKNRGFYVLKHTDMTAILVECCFCDSARDMANYNAINMAIAIKNGIVGKIGTYASAKTPLKLQVHRPFTYLKPSTEQATELSPDGLTRVMKGVYTVEEIEPQEEGHYWVKLKSGEKGFIFAGHVKVID